VAAPIGGIRGGDAIFPSHPLTTLPRGLNRHGDLRFERARDYGYETVLRPAI
jgi:hypothetical protein